MMENNKLYQAIKEFNAKGSLQDQAKILYELEKKYKNEEEELEYIKIEMCKLNNKIIDTLDLIEEWVDVELFKEKFEIDEYDPEESYYNNILISNNKIGHVCRSGLIYSEKIVEEINEINENTYKEVIDLLEESKIKFDMEINLDELYIDFYNKEDINTKSFNIEIAKGTTNAIKEIKTAIREFKTFN